MIFRIKQPFKNLRFCFWFLAGLRSNAHLKWSLATGGTPTLCNDLENEYLKSQWGGSGREDGSAKSQRFNWQRTLKFTSYDCRLSTGATQWFVTRDVSLPLLHTRSPSTANCEGTNVKWSSSQDWPRWASGGKRATGQKARRQKQ